MKPSADLDSSFEKSEMEEATYLSRYDSKKKKGGEDENHSLPCDVIVEILRRLPVKCMLRFEIVCKEWCALIQNPTFLNLHFDIPNTEEGHTCLFLEDLSSNISYIYSLKLNQEVEVEGEVEEDDPTPLQTTFIVKNDLPADRRTTVKAYCNGLLCYYTWSHSEDNLNSTKQKVDFWVCNLSTKQKVKLPPPPPPCDFINFEHELNPYTFGFGFNPSTKNYTVVFYSHQSGECHLFTLGAGEGAGSSWRKTSTRPSDPYDPHYEEFLSMNGSINVVPYDPHSEEFLSINGVLYWNSPSLHLITSFDLRTEEFGVLSYPINLSKWSQMYEFQGSVCLFYSDTRDVLNLWVLKDYNNHSWGYHRFILPHPLPFFLPAPLTFWAPKKIFKNWDVAAVISTCEKNAQNDRYDHHRHYLHSYNLLTCANQKMELLGLPSNANIVAIGDCEHRNMITSTTG